MNCQTAFHQMQKYNQRTHFLKPVKGKLILQLDDLQWVDDATMDLIRSLAISNNMRGLLIVCIYRDEDVDAKKNVLDKFFLMNHLMIHMIELGI